jgi:uncharacterized protein YbaP (TraB family)
MVGQERKMRRILWIVLSLFLWPQLAGAKPAPQCAGADLLAQMQAADPATHKALFQRAHTVPNGRGKFWRVSRPAAIGGTAIGGAPYSYLFGTFHDTEIARQPLKPGVAASLESARLLVVELTGQEQERLQARMANDPDYVIDRNRSGLIAQLSAAERSVVEKVLASRGVPLSLAEKLRAPILFSLLTVPQCILNAMQQGQPTLDQLLMSRAIDAGIPVAGLETYEQAIGSISDIPADMMNEILLEALRDLSGEEDIRRTTVGLYQAGEIAAIWEFSIVSSARTLGMARSREIMAQLGATVLERRNRAWMDTLVPELEKGGVFAAFGAMHLVGAAGVIELLREAGFEVTRLDG